MIRILHGDCRDVLNTRISLKTISVNSHEGRRNEAGNRMSKIMNEIRPNAESDTAACLAFYNEIDPYAAQWLRNLIKAGHIAPGVVDERDIRDIKPSELDGYTQCHFFAGIGGWSYALWLAGWPDDRPVWTGSCPCQPFSAAGKGRGHEDERHLWPTWQRLIRECRPECVFGEQVASADGLAWLDVVCTDVEAAGYAIGAVDLCAAGVGAPHIRQRLWFVAESDRSGCDRWARSAQENGRQLRKPQPVPRSSSSVGIVADTGARGLGIERRAAGDGHAQHIAHADERGSPRSLGNAERTERWPDQEITTRGQQAADFARDTSLMGNADDARSQRRSIGRNGADQRAAGPASVVGFWSDAEWIACRDGKARPVEPGTFPLAHGAAARVGRLRAYGNCINAEAAKAFIGAYLETRSGFKETQATTSPNPAFEVEEGA